MKSYSDTNQIPAENKESLLRKINSIRKFITRRRVTAMVAVALIILGGYFVYEKYFHLTPAEKAKKELVAAVVAVSKHMILPEGDEPVLATVTDAEALIKQQAFFAGSVKGDQLLLYPKNMKAIIWSPSRGVIVNVGPIQQQQSAVVNQQSASNSPQPTAGANTAVQNMILTVEVRNGTGKTGYASTVADQIHANTGYSIIKVADAAKKDYTKTVIFERVSSNGKKQLASALATALKGDFVTALPNGEKNTEADVLIILGSNE